MKRILSLIMMVVLVVSITGCGSKEVTTAGSSSSEVTTEVKETTSEEPVEISLSMVYPEGHAQYPALRKLLDQFKEENPDIVINEELLPSAQFSEKMLVNYAAATVPNVFQVWEGTGNSKYVEAGEWLDITKYLDEDAEWKNGFKEGVLDTYVYEGTEGIYGVPYGMYYVGFYYNKDLFTKVGAEVPETWEEFLTVIEKLNSAEITPMSFGGADAWRSRHLFLNLHLKLVGIDGAKAIGAREESYESEGVITALDKMVELVDNNAFDSNFFGTGYAEEIADFFSEKTAMRYSGTWTIGEIESADAPDGFADKVGYFAVPYFESAPENEDIWFGGVNDSIAVSAKGTPEELEASVKLAKYLSNADSAKLYLEETGLIPAIKIEGELNSSNLLKEVQNVVATAKGSSGGVANYEALAEVSTLLDELPQAVIGGGITSEAAAKELQEVVDKN